MAENAFSPGAGGFMAPSLPSPAPTTSSVNSIRFHLPHPRSRALRPGSVKEDQVRNFISERMAHITRRFVKKTGQAPAGDDDVQGYKTMGELCRDLEEVVNILWLSGTPSLQIPSLLNIASEFNSWLPAFPPSPTATFAILHKLDHCFASLLCGEDIDTHDPLPGFENGLRSGMSRTDMVRCKSTVQHSRVVIVDVMARQVPGEVVEEEEGESREQTTADESEMSGVEGSGSGRRGVAFLDEEEEDLYMDVARVYENTLVKLGETLGELGMETVEMSAD